MSCRSVWAKRFIEFNHSTLIFFEEKKKLAALPILVVVASRFIIHFLSCLLSYTFLFSMCFFASPNAAEQFAKWLNFGLFTMTKMALLYCRCQVVLLSHFDSQNCLWNPLCGGRKRERKGDMKRENVGV